MTGCGMAQIDATNLAGALHDGDVSSAWATGFLVLSLLWLMRIVLLVAGFQIEGQYLAVVVRF